MALTIRLSGKIQDALGPEAAEDLMDWMHGVDERHTHLRELHELTTTRFEARLGEAKAELRTEIAELRGEMRVGFARSDNSILELRRQMETGLAGIETRFERRFGELMKWSLVFWITSLGSLVGTIAVLNRLH